MIEFNRKIEGFKFLYLGDVVVCTFKLGKSSQVELNDLTYNVLRKVGRIKFEKRTPSYLKKVLSEEEFGIIKNLIEANVLTLYKGGDYGKSGGVINIPDGLFSRLRNHITTTAQPRVDNKPPSSTTVQNDSRDVQHTTPTIQAIIEQLNKNGYATIKNDKILYALSRYLRENRMDKKVKGIKGFDGVLYLCTDTFFTEKLKQIEQWFEQHGEIDLNKVDKEQYYGLKTVLLMLLESGEIIEKQRDVFCPA